METSPTKKIRCDNCNLHLGDRSGNEITIHEAVYVEHPYLDDWAPIVLPTYVLKVNHTIRLRCRCRVTTTVCVSKHKKLIDKAA